VRHPWLVPSDVYLDDIVLFELPTAGFADRLLDHLGSERFGWRQPTNGVTVVGVLLTTDDLDLALLLRCVQTWLERVDLAAIRFEVDGRTYMLEAKQAVQPVAGRLGDERAARHSRRRS